MHLTSAFVTIDPARCAGCGACIRVCPSDILSLENSTAHAAPDTNSARCLQCGHCMAACPESAITIPALDPNQHNFSTFALDPAWLAPGKGLPTQDLALIGSSPGATCPKEDALLAAGNILLAAHTMGLGTCLIGYAVAAMAEDRSIQKKLGIPESETIHAAVALGYSDETFQRITGRKQPTIRFR